MAERNRKIPIQFYVNEDENEQIEKQIKKTKLNKSEYLRRISTKGVIVKVDMSSIENLVYEINKIGININQIAKRVNESDTIFKSEIKELQESIDEICEKISERL
ncbi:plasmid mobilization relaxosome protein MobC [Clostridium perfringens]|uniref:plasmid mobilization protein n=1 Tax=Clostridium TaxID=1485 RepID=UPI000D8FE435|nr:MULTISPECIES: plasmid mobilization relaxosome protein MobC [Clostridium]EGT4141324.1 plasmid mobilization relaxosome protein MobC [Clostridium perfringens]ELC8368289.1 plasmid mobilization relaxosome protein MobC [Clostridium perfringens]MBI6111844.1 plasmid mobilization relaxosome protein MobC [Clostridium perfringens]MBI6114899.1 plasmid mobilization relaxosome protein MobC [Clostridium perfringens]MCX0367961.1 plasmid mobilization relaxosome protein MobC [Clostridium perfringens]